MAGAELVLKSKDALLIEQGTKNTKLMRLISGSLRVEREKGVTAGVIRPSPSAVIGDTAVITEIKSATVSVYADENDTELEEISISLLSNLLNTNHALCMRFYRDIARKLASQLRQLNSSAKPDDNKQKSASGSDAVSQKIENAEAKKFGLSDAEKVALVVKCARKEKVSSAGNLYLFPSNLVFELEKPLFGMDPNTVVSYDKLKKGPKIDEKKKTLSVSTKTDKLNFEQIPDVKNVQNVLQALIDESNAKGLSRRMGSKVELNVKGSSLAALTLNERDMGLIRNGAIERKYTKGEAIVQEGSVVAQRLFQVITGSCTVQKVIDGNQITIASMPKDSMFGELSFLEEGEKPTATASVIAGENVTVTILEGWFINSLFVDDPSMGGKFYHHLCSIVAKRLNEREMELIKKK